MSEERFETLRFLEAVLFAASEPLTEKVLAHRLPEDSDVKGLLSELKDHYANRGVVLMQFEDRWAFRTSPDLSHRMSIERKVVRKLTRAAVETLAIIAYHQPVTRAEIEEIRGVAISKGTLDSLLEADWIKPKGRRETPGRPVTWGTTTGFLEHFSLESCEALPGVEELRASGLLDARSAISTLGTQGAGQILRADGTEEEEEAAAIELRGEPNLELDEEANAAKLSADGEPVADDAYEAELLARVEQEAAAAIFAPAEGAAHDAEEDDADEDDADESGDEDEDDDLDDDDGDDDDDDDEEGGEGDAAEDVDADDESEDEQGTGRTVRNS